MAHIWNRDFFIFSLNILPLRFQNLNIVFIKIGENCIKITNEYYSYWMFA